MTANYVSVVYDLTQFGISNINNAVVCSYKDDGVNISVSFDGGNTFKKIAAVNEKFEVQGSTGKIQVKVEFSDYGQGDIYKVKTSGYFYNLEAGTSIFFTKKTTQETHSTNIGYNGGYTINLPRGEYKIWYNNSGVKTTLVESMNPEMVVSNKTGIDKEAIIESLFRDFDWATNMVFDTFADKGKKKYGNSIIDVDGNLSDGVTDRKMYFWAIGFD